MSDPGTYRGLVEKIPYFKDLGITAIELLPVQEFNAHELKARNPQTGEVLRNYWGYNPVAFSAVNGAYSSTGSRGQQTLEFKEMVRQMHAAGIEVIIDVVLNHTAENDELGPTFAGAASRIRFSIRWKRTSVATSTPPEPAIPSMPITRWCATIF